MVSSGPGATGSGAPGRGTPARHRSPARRRWDLAAGDAESVLAGARKAFFVMAGLLAALWIMQIANWADHYQLTASYGIRKPTVLGSPAP